MTGADLAAMLRAAAQSAGVAVGVYIRPLTDQGSSWLHQLEQAASPRPGTVARVHALVAGAPIPVKQRKGSRVRSVPAAGWAQPYPDPIPSVPAIERDPCWRCGTRGDLGCAHRSPAVPVDRFAERRA